LHCFQINNVIIDFDSVNRLCFGWVDNDTNCLYDCLCPRVFIRKTMKSVFRARCDMNGCPTRGDWRLDDSEDGSSGVRKFSKYAKAPVVTCCTEGDHRSSLLSDFARSGPHVAREGILCSPRCFLGIFKYLTFKFSSFPGV